MLMLASKVASHCTVLRSENWAFGRLSRSHTITMAFIPNNLVGQVNVSCTTEVNCQRFSCTHVVTAEQQYKKTVSHWGCHAGTTLSLSPGAFSSLLATSP